MKRADKSIKIKIENHSYTREDLESMLRWEDEGGKTDDNNIPGSVNSPVKPGQILEVVEGDVIYENGELYYLAKLNLLALH